MHQSAIPRARCACLECTLNDTVYDTGSHILTLVVRQNDYLCALKQLRPNPQDDARSLARFLLRVTGDRRVPGSPGPRVPEVGLFSPPQGDPKSI